MQRNTKQREAILGAFQRQNRPLTIEEVLAEAAKCHSTLNLSTVYRNLKKLLHEGKIHAVVLPGSATRYELTSPLHHHHFLCEMCGHLYDLLGCPSGIDSLVPRGFKMVSHSLTLKGVCASCG